MGDETSGRNVLAVQSVAAATRAAGSTLFVCPVGWSSHVYQITGAAAMVWQHLDDFSTLPDLAARCGVDVDDDYFIEAIRMLTKVELIVEVEELGR